MKSIVRLLPFAISLFATFVSPAKSMGAEIDIVDRLTAHRFYLKNHSTLYGNPDFKNVDLFKKKLNSLSNKDKVIQAIGQLDPLFADDELRALIYWKFIDPRPERASLVLQHFVLYRALILRDIIEHPVLYSPSEKETARAQYQSLVGAPYNPDSVTKDALARAASFANELVASSDPTVFASKVTSNPLIKGTASQLRNLAQGYVLSPLGFIPGNQVEVINDNDVSHDRIKWVNDRVTFNGGSFNWNAPYMFMPGTGQGEGNIIFNDPIFKRVREMIDSSRESVFIDIFLFGGTMGGTLAQHLMNHAVKMSATNPNFRVYLLHDYSTTYGLTKEMMPVFEYIQNRIESDPNIAKSVFLLQANIQRHPPGIPFGITNFIQKTPEVHKVIEKMDTYYESKIDHSKVIVVDANSDRPKAYFGSKNWADHSGSYYYDDAIYVEGPGAAVVQGLYYDDVEAALTTDEKEKQWFYYKEKKLDNAKYLSKRQEILDQFKLKRGKSPQAGPESVRYAEANVDGRIRNARNMLIDMIRFANHHIYMEQLFLYDKYVVDALLKRKKQVPQLDVKIMADHNGNFGMNGFPNTIFTQELLKAGIQVRARKTFGVPFTFPNGEQKEFHQENHRKLTVVDGKWLLGGSSNLNPDTLQGSFREFGAQVFNKSEIARIERNFLRDWADKEKTMAVDAEPFELKLKNTHMSPRTSELINGVARTLLRSKDFIEGRENKP